ncbi:MAG: YebC/PmpR family DNA-binding transcriptional regulator [Algiphilus sp.]|uniref:YebC/PmpR family DNA-binding transcriptional regulator n=1 Tax=Algiphilus sp. TaxID=1872431 RepID=UPI001CA67694|nr:YebC/PmpR family DNA-binding transcriptional regulator [Algiphilus sp.]MBY8965176.1 YebC/PmpR family DNA-binding transcriptional regulator [Algiphilus acroporae]MCI5063243.1 YebC/PmpR family DNA-binding transcriptional regulator [Algiphilus sp.]MCI5104930.1 YebC/PmpR family DNA-binding transcriptional regulator [Algiphilus sp.]MCR9092024.1 YebC/PmpR family DNA-binding transcriptional regulator [Pseudomonadota bacterium]
MAGHSKWSNIQHRKNAQDKKRGAVFTKLVREITVAARLGGGDLEGNPRLRLAVDKALAVSMPKDNIERAIKRGSGQDDSANVQEIRYEGYAPGGIAIMVDCMTDNQNRTVADVRHAFSKHGGNLGADGSVAYLFSRQGVIQIALDGETTEEAVLEAALDAGAEDVVVDDEGSSVDVLTRPESFQAVRTALEQAGFPVAEADVTERPATTIEVGGEQAESVLKLLERLDDLEDVQNVYSNAVFSEDALSAS